MNIRKAITLTDQQDRWIKAQATAGNFDDGGYIREPIRRDQEQYPVSCIRCRPYARSLRKTRDFLAETGCGSNSLPVRISHTR